MLTHHPTGALSPGDLWTIHFTAHLGTAAGARLRIHGRMPDDHEALHNRGGVAATQLAVAHELLSLAGQWVPIVSVRRVDEAVQVYNITNIRGGDTYFAEGMLTRTYGLGR